jgi:hypothetical protein
LLAAAHKRRSLGIASHWPFDQQGWFLPEHTTAVSLLDRLLHHASVVVVVAGGGSYRMREARAKGGTPPKRTNQPTRGMRTFTWPPAGTATWPLSSGAGFLHAIAATMHGCRATIGGVGGRAD